MTIKAEQVGRRLVLTVTDENGAAVFEPYIVEPVPMKAGRQLTADYLAVASQTGTVSVERQAGMFREALNEHNAARAEEEVSQVEGDELCVKALMWQTVIGMDGIRAFDNAGGGVAGMVKALRLLTGMSAALPSPTSPSTGWESLTSQEGTPGTSTPQGGVSTVSKLPPARRSIRQGNPHRAA